MLATLLIAGIIGGLVKGIFLSGVIFALLIVFIIYLVVRKRR